MTTYIQSKPPKLNVWKIVAAILIAYISTVIIIQIFK